MFNLNLKTIQNPEVKLLASSVLDYVMNNPSCENIREECIKLTPTIILNSNIGIDWLRDSILTPAFNNKKYQELLGIFMDVISLSMPPTIILCSKMQSELHEYHIIAPNGLIETECPCPQDIKNDCVIFVLEKMRKRRGILMNVQLNENEREILHEIVQKYIPIIIDPDTNSEVKQKILQILPKLIKSVKFMLVEPIVTVWLKILSTTDPILMNFVPNYVKSVIDQTKKRLDELGPDETRITKNKFSDLFLDGLIKALNHAFSSQDIDYQENYLLLLENYSATENITATEVLDCFRFALRFLVKSTSKVKCQAYSTVEIICRNFNVRPYQILNWYRMANIRFVMDIVATNYCKSNVKMMETIKEVSF